MAAGASGSTSAAAFLPRGRSGGLAQFSRAMAGRALPEPRDGQSNFQNSDESQSTANGNRNWLQNLEKPTLRPSRSPLLDTNRLSIAPVTISKFYEPNSTARLLGQQRDKGRVVKGIGQEFRSQNPRGQFWASGPEASGRSKQTPRPLVRILYDTNLLRKKILESREHLLEMESADSRREQITTPTPSFSTVENAYRRKKEKKERKEEEEERERVPMNGNNWGRRRTEAEERDWAAKALLPPSLTADETKLNVETSNQLGAPKTRPRREIVALKLDIPPPESARLEQGEDTNSKSMRQRGSMGDEENRRELGGSTKEELNADNGDNDATTREDSEHMMPMDQARVELKPRPNESVLIVETAEDAHRVAQLLLKEHRHRIHACDTEVTGINLKKESPVGHGRLVCFSIYCGPGVDFGDGHSCIWVDVLGGGEGTLKAFQPYFEDKEVKKVWHNYSFDYHILANHGIRAQGFYADTMHMARLYDTSRKGKSGGYTLEALTKERQVMNGSKNRAGLQDVWDDEEVLKPKRSLKELFGVKQKKKNGIEGKLVVVPAISAIQTDSNERSNWIDYSTFDTVSTFLLWRSLQRKLNDMSENKWSSLYSEEQGTLYDFYQRYWRPFAEVLIGMEREGMLVDRDHLAAMERKARQQQVASEESFRKWAKKQCPEAEFMNVGSDAQIRQLLFGGCENPKLKACLLQKRVFKVPNTTGFIEEGKKNPKKMRPITLRRIESNLPEDQRTASGWPTIGGAILKRLAGVSFDYTTLEEEEEEEEESDSSDKGDFTTDSNSDTERNGSHGQGIENDVALNVAEAGEDSESVVGLGSVVELAAVNSGRSLNQNGGRVWWDIEAGDGEWTDEEVSALGNASVKDREKLLELRGREARNALVQAGGFSTYVRAWGGRFMAQLMEKQQGAYEGDVVLGRSSCEKVQKEALRDTSAEGNTVRALKEETRDNVDNTISNRQDDIANELRKCEEEQRDMLKYGKAYEAFGKGMRGREACWAFAALVEVAAINTLISNFLLPLQGTDIMGPTKRVHCSLNINTETGRLSARKPSLQNQPGMEKDRYYIRKAFTAAEGCAYVVADYGQLELRLLAHLAKCKSMLEAFRAGGDFHSRTAMNMYVNVRKAVDAGEVLLEWDPQPGQEKPPVPLLKDRFRAERQKAKMLNFSIAYGKTAMGIAKDWKVSKLEAEATLELWYRDRPEVRQWQQERVEEAKRTNRVHTLLGRPRHLPEINSDKLHIASHYERAAINTPVQGSAADVAMLAMLRLNASEELAALGYKLLLQVHDEVILEGPAEHVERAQELVVDCMAHPFPEQPGDFSSGKNCLLVELVVDAKHAQDWYSAK